VYGRGGVVACVVHLWEWARLSSRSRHARNRNERLSRYDAFVHGAVALPRQARYGTMMAGMTRRRQRGSGPGPGRLIGIGAMLPGARRGRGPRTGGGRYGHPARPAGAAGSAGGGVPGRVARASPRPAVPHSPTPPAVMSSARDVTARPGGINRERAITASAGTLQAACWNCYRAGG
jgi:hypothetical protein